MDYETAVMFELAGNVLRTLEYAGRMPTQQDATYIAELRSRLEEQRKTSLGFCVECEKPTRWGNVFCGDHK